MTAYVTGIVAAQRLGSKVASFVALTEVMFAVLAAWLILGELPGAIQLLDGLLIVAGVVCVRVDELRSSEAGAVQVTLDSPNPVEPLPRG